MPTSEVVGWYLPLVLNITLWGGWQVGKIGTPTSSLLRVCLFNDPKHWNGRASPKMSHGRKGIAVCNQKNLPITPKAVRDVWGEAKQSKAQRRVLSERRAKGFCKKFVPASCVFFWKTGAEREATNLGVPKIETKPRTEADVGQ